MAILGENSGFLVQNLVFLCNAAGVQGSCTSKLDKEAQKIENILCVNFLGAAAPLFQAVFLGYQDV